jgi:pimeloyl-ACP methyl ester carboxylesterase/class 3 adenylate cyclase
VEFEPGPVRYAKSHGVNIAYRTIGEGPVDLVVVPGWVSNIEAIWALPGAKRFLCSLAEFSRVILLDKRGTGMSDRVVGMPSLETRMDDVNVVMTACGSERAFLFGVSEGGVMNMLFAATYPERTLGLITFGAYARRKRSDNYPWAPSDEERERALEAIAEQWGEMNVDKLAPSVSGTLPSSLLASYFRQSASPSAAIELAKMNAEVDVIDILPTISVPTLVMNRVGDRDTKVEEARFIASKIGGAKLVELPGTDHIPIFGDQDALLDEIRGFVTGSRHGVQADRMLATVLFEDIADSTETAMSLGDQRWTSLLAQHMKDIEAIFEEYRGQLVKSTGDGVLGIFDGPARAIRAAHAIRDAGLRLGLQSRAGLHIGEIHVTRDDIAGIGVHIAARTIGCVPKGEVWVTRTLKDICVGAGITFEPVGRFSFKGVEDEWELYRTRVA